MRFAATARNGDTVLPNQVVETGSRKAYEDLTYLDGTGHSAIKERSAPSLPPVKKYYTVVIDPNFKRFICPRSFWSSFWSQTQHETGSTLEVIG